MKLLTPIFIALLGAVGLALTFALATLFHTLVVYLVWTYLAPLFINTRPLTEQELFGAGAALALITITFRGIFYREK